MKVLQVNIFFNEGSTGKIVADIHQRLLRDGHESYVVFGRGKGWQLEDPTHLYRTTPGSRSEFYRKLTRITGLRYNTASLETKKLLRYIDQIKPDIVHLHCLNCAYVNPFILLNHLGEKGYKVLVTHHADATITANCDHAFECDKWKTGCGSCATNRLERRSFLVDATHYSWIQMRNAFGRVKNLYASGVSDWMTNRVQQSPFFKDCLCKTILNGVDTSSFRLREERNNLRKQLGYSQDDKIVLYVTPNFSDPNKGGKYLLEIANQMPDINFIIVGSNIKIIDSQSNIKIAGSVNSKDEMASYYSMADATILTSYRESFSMVTAESLCCGTPVVGFKAGAPETIALPEYSEFVDYGDVGALKSGIDHLIKREINKSVLSDLACEKYNAEKMFYNYFQYYIHMIDN